MCRGRNLSIKAYKRDGYCKESMLNRYSTDIYLEYEVQLILSEIEAVEDILKENKKSLQIK